MQKRVYNGKSNAKCPWCDTIVLAENLAKHQTTEKCRRRTAERDANDQEIEDFVGAHDRPECDLNEDSTLSDRLGMGFDIMSDD